MSATARLGGAVTEQAAGQKTAIYNHLVQTGRLFQPIAAEMSYVAFFLELGRKVIQKMTESPAFFSSAYRSRFSAFVPCCYTTVSLATRSDHFKLFVLLLTLFLAFGIFAPEGIKIITIYTFYLSVIRS